MLTDELTDPHHVTADYTGQPGERTFHLQAQDQRVLVTLLCEKVQVAGLAELLTRLLGRLDDKPADDWDRAAMALRQPIEPRWRVGELAVGLDIDRGRFVLDATELAATGVDPDVVGIDPEDAAGDDLRSVRIWMTQDQARRLAAHAQESVAQGRPPGEQGPVVKDISGQVVFPSTNGHGRLQE